MSRFGIRRRLKGAVKKAMGADESSVPTPPAPAAAAPTPTPPKPPAAPSMGAPVAAPATDEPPKGRMWVQAQGVRPDEVIDGSVHQVGIFGTRYALYKTDDGEFHATSDSCPHAGGPLGEGELDGFDVTCPFHSFTFDIRDGSCTSGEDLSVRCIDVKVDNGKVFLEVPQ
ncbi:MAG: Rieske (2Fe-2S) protein [Proteobacteria bacterium]|nr:Rieske (2Fe-2S) protein [Pseudomonadota bacterium]